MMHSGMRFDASLPLQTKMAPITFSAEMTPPTVQELNQWTQYLPKMRGVYCDETSDTPVPYLGGICQLDVQRVALRKVDMTLYLKTFQQYWELLKPHSSELQTQLLRFSEALPERDFAQCFSILSDLRRSKLMSSEQLAGAFLEQLQQIQTSMPVHWMRIVNALQQVTPQLGMLAQQTGSEGLLSVFLNNLLSRVRVQSRTQYSNPSHYVEKGILHLKHLLAYSSLEQAITIWKHFDTESPSYETLNANLEAVYTLLNQAKSVPNATHFAKSSLRLLESLKPLSVIPIAFFLIKDFLEAGGSAEQLPTASLLSESALVENFARYGKQAKDLPSEAERKLWGKSIQSIRANRSLTLWDEAVFWRLSEALYLFLRALPVNLDDAEKSQMLKMLHESEKEPEKLITLVGEYKQLFLSAEETPYTAEGLLKLLTQKSSLRFIREAKLFLDHFAPFDPEHLYFDEILPALRKLPEEEISERTQALLVLLAQFKKMPETRRFLIQLFVKQCMQQNSMSESRPVGKILQRKQLLLAANFCQAVQSNGAFHRPLTDFVRVFQQLSAGEGISETEMPLVVNRLWSPHQPPELTEVVDSILFKSNSLKKALRVQHFLSALQHHEPQGERPLRQTYLKWLNWLHVSHIERLNDEEVEKLAYFLLHHTEPDKASLFEPVSYFHPWVERLFSLGETQELKAIPNERDVSIFLKDLLSLPEPDSQLLVLDAALYMLKEADLRRSAQKVDRDLILRLPYPNAFLNYYFQHQSELQLETVYRLFVYMDSQMNMTFGQGMLPEFLAVSVPHLDRVERTAPTLSKKHSQYVSMGLTRLKRYTDPSDNFGTVRTVTRQALNNWSKMATIGLSYPKWQYDSMTRWKTSGRAISSPLLVKSGLFKAIPPRDSDSTFHGGFLHYEPPSKQSIGLSVELRRGYIVISQPGLGTVVIRNSSLLFGRDKLPEFAYYHPTKVYTDVKHLFDPKAEVLNPNPREEPFLPVMSKVLNATHAKQVKVHQNITKLLSAFQALMENYMLWKGDFPNGIPNPGFAVVLASILGLPKLPAFGEKQPLKLQWCEPNGLPFSLKTLDSSLPSVHAELVYYQRVLKQEITPTVEEYAQKLPQLLDFISFGQEHNLELLIRP